MLSITTKTQYGFLALIDLAEYYGAARVQIKDMVARRGIPKNYVEQILNRLTKTGLVKSLRGNKGGYELGHHPDNISFLNIVEALEGEISFHDKIHGHAAIEEVLLEAESTIRKQLDVTLSQLLSRQQQLDQHITFSI